MTRTLASLMLASATSLVGCATDQHASVAGAPCCGACAVPAGNATAVNTKTADALREALMDERRAEAFYSGVISKHGQARPFSNIVHAEERHAAVVEGLMSRHGVAIPSDAISNLPAVPSTLPECNRLAAQLERENIAMYDRLLADVTEPDIRTAFENLRDASKNNHLTAFERWSTNAGSAMTGRGMGYGYRRGSGNVALGVCRGPCAATP